MAHPEPAPAPGPRRSWNPLAFLPAQTTLLASGIYTAIVAVLLWVHLGVPRAPPATAVASAYPGVNITQAWRDLQVLSDGYHPWGSRRNEEVRQFLLHRLADILLDVNVRHKTVYAGHHGFIDTDENPAPVTIFANDTSNFTSVLGARTVYGESTNLIVYIRGTDDEEGDWWKGTEPYDGPSGVLVNAHYDSVSSGLGATDDGVGVVTVLQLVSHFSKHQPRRGLVALLNNGEENGLYGARNYVRHPVSRFPRTFVNLEGAGAGGRATLFRSTDTEVTRAYASSPYSFGTVISNDGFRRGFIRSGTDYTIFTEELGMRGLDVAFYEHRASYHTDRDNAPNTSPDSLWHMLSSALATVQELTAHSGNDFESFPDENGGLHFQKGTNAFYFDLLGRTFAAGQINTLFALSVTLLVAGPILLILLEIMVHKSDKWYILAGKRFLRSSDDDEAVRLHGRRGFFRPFIAVIVASGTLVLLAFLVNKANPYILYRSEYAVLAMLFSGWLAIAWLILAGAAHVRPSALQRAFSLFFLYAISWICLGFAAVGERQLQIASGYIFVFYNASALVALLISHTELFFLPSRSTYVEQVLGPQDNTLSVRPQSNSSTRPGGDDHQDTEPTERSSLLSATNTGPHDHHTFTAFRRHHRSKGRESEDRSHVMSRGSYEDEQAWSSSLPQWTWVLQYLVLVPINVIIVGQILLLLTSATHQTPADGNAVLPLYLLLVSLTVLLLLPLTPFLHRFTYHIPSFMFIVFAACLVYNLLAQPFSRDARMKYYFAQCIDLDTGTNYVTTTGIDGYVQQVVDQMPSAAGEVVSCGAASMPNRKGLLSCSWRGLSPNVAPSGNGTRQPVYRDWLDLEISRHNNSAVFALRGRNTKICGLSFENLVSKVSIAGGANDQDPAPADQAESSEILLFSREFEKTFYVNVTWNGQSAAAQRGRAWCAWDDVNLPGVIPAFDEQRRFAPIWSVVTKTADGLLEGYREFDLGVADT